MLERIEAFRRRRPRLLDEVVTLAHGAGGKSSAALVDAVFRKPVDVEALDDFLSQREHHAADEEEEKEPPVPVLPPGSH